VMSGQKKPSLSEVRDEKINDDDDRGAKTQKYHAR
jgi:hypothetical protein